MTVEPDELEYLQRAREDLSPFHKWIVRVHGYTDKTAAVMVSTVCRATWESAEDGAEPDPVNILDRDIRHSDWYRVRAALRFYYLWLVSSDGSGKLGRYYRRQLARLEVTRKARGGGTGIVKPAGGVKPAPPLPPDVYLALLRGLKRWSRRNSARYPWIWALMSMRLKLGWEWNVLLSLSRENMVCAMADGRIGVINGYLRNRRYVAPLWLVMKEVDFLISSPWEWATLADIVSPSSTKSCRVTRAYRICWAAFRKYLSDTLPKEYRSQNARGAVKKRLRTSTEIWLLKRLNGDWLALGQITGKTKHLLQNNPHLLEGIS